ncbi:mCG122565 [Mus musculus]|nr:mCG122565 [Mus musculus]
MLAVERENQAFVLHLDQCSLQGADVHKGGCLTVVQSVNLCATPTVSGDEEMAQWINSCQLRKKT